jgi:uncharacterized membrane protein
MSTRIDRALLSFSRHWVAFLTMFFGLYIGLPVLAPILMEAKIEAPARAIYTIYGGLCHQLGYRSWYLFGEQIAYPREVFTAYTGIDSNDIWSSRAFIGNEQMGWKVGYCQRDVAIYGTIVLFGLIYSFPTVRNKLKSPHWLLYLAIGIAPVAFDGFSQLFSQYPYSQFPLFNWLPPRESTPLLRSFTGALFGFANAWLAYPYLEESMRELRADIEKKLAYVAPRGESS